MKFQLIFDLKGILVDQAAIERFGYDYLLYSLKRGKKELPRVFLYGLAAAITKNLSPNFAYEFGEEAFRDVPRTLVEEFAERYARYLPRKSLTLMRLLRRLGYEIFVITHDIHDLNEKVYERMEVEEGNVIDNKFKWNGSRVEGLELLVDNKLHAYFRLVRDGRIDPRKSVVIGHSKEEVPLIPPSRFAIGPKNSEKAFKRRADALYKDLLELPKLLEKLEES